MDRNSYDIIGEEVLKFWDKNYPADVVAFFEQKYSFENDSKWRAHEELVECTGNPLPKDKSPMVFLNDFCEGESDVRNVHIVMLSDLLEEYRKQKGW